MGASHREFSGISEWKLPHLLHWKPVILRDSLEFEVKGGHPHAMRPMTHEIGSGQGTTAR
jgi:hypothetical protein